MPGLSAANPVDADPGHAMGRWINDVNTWWHDGILAGTSAFLVSSRDGICWEALANTTASISNGSSGT